MGSRNLLGIYQNAVVGDGVVVEGSEAAALAAIKGHFGAVTSDPAADPSDQKKTAPTKPNLG